MAHLLDLEALLERLVLADHEDRDVVGEDDVRGDRDVGLAVGLHAEDVDAVELTDIELANAFPEPVPRDRYFEDGVLFIDLDVVEDVVGGVADGGPLGDLLLRVDDLVGTVPQEVSSEFWKLPLMVTKQTS